MNYTETQPNEILRWVLSVAIPAISGFSGVIIGAWLTKRRERFQRRYDFATKQLNDFYSPMLGLRSEIEALSELRETISQSANRVWKKLCDEAREHGGTKEVERVTKERWPAFQKIIEYNNLQLTQELLPSYRRMLTIFRDNLWLAEKETREYYETLLEFVELWNRSEQNSIPDEVLEVLKHSEDPLKLFYEDLQKKHEEIRTKLALGEV